MGYPIAITDLHARAFTSDYAFREHVHVHHQGYFVLAGAVHYRIEDRSCRLAAGQGVIVPAGLRRAPRAASARGRALIVTFVSPWDEWGRPLGETFTLDPAAREDAAALLAEAARPIGHVADILFHRLCLRLVGPVRFRGLTADGRDPRSRAIADGRQLVEQIEAIMQANLDQPMQLDDFAQLAGISRAHLRRLFQAHRGVAPCTHFRRLRLDRAHLLLAAGRTSVTEAAHALGFSSSQHLALAFRQRFGYPPMMAARRAG